jgi:GNAT superfamily N-acetyltransferase
MDGLAYIDVLAVLPARMRQGVGAALLEAACAWAKENGYSAICTIAMTDVPWSAPFFESRGFTEAQQRVGRRVVMRRELRMRVEDSV